MNGPHSDGDGVGDNWDLLPLDPTRVDITASYSFVGEAWDDGAGGMLSTGDFDGDGRRDIVIAAPQHGALGIGERGRRVCDRRRGLAGGGCR